MIKAIQTQYKGYAFRSRLEARWAVYFDERGFDWEYEPQGYEINGLKYLPDFRVDGRYLEVKRKDAFEIKAIRKNRVKRVYVAGKIGIEEFKDTEFNCTYPIVKNDWREELSKGFNYWRRQKDKIHCINLELDDRNFIKEGFLYEGPHFSVEHGGVRAHQRALDQISRSDFVFAWLDANDAYGTICEIVYAALHRIPVLLAYGPNCNAKEHWFVSNFASLVLGGEEKDDITGSFFPDQNILLIKQEKEKLTVNDAWDLLVGRFFKQEPLCLEEKKVSELSKHCHQEVWLVMGDPYDHKLYEYKNGYTDGTVKAFTGSTHKQAAVKARSARFEHGRSGDA